MIDKSCVKDKFKKVRLSPLEIFWLLFWFLLIISVIREFPFFFIWIIFLFIILFLVKRKNSKKILVIEDKNNSLIENENSSLICDYKNFESDNNKLKIQSSNKVTVKNNVEDILELIVVICYLLIICWLIMYSLGFGAAYFWLNLWIICLFWIFFFILWIVLKSSIISSDRFFFLIWLILISCQRKNDFGVNQVSNDENIVDL